MNFELNYFFNNLLFLLVQKGNYKTLVQIQIIKKKMTTNKWLKKE